MANNSRKRVDMNNRVSYVWTSQQQDLLRLASAGDEEACGKLFETMKGLLESVHRYSQDGQYPTSFGHDFNHNGRTFEQASGDIYIAFRNAVRRFDGSLRVPFGAYVVAEIKLRAMDWTRDRQSDRHVVVGQRLSDGSEVDGKYRLLTDEDFGRSVTAYYEGKSESLSDSETHPVEYCEIMDLVCRIRREICRHGDPRLVDFVKYFMQYGGEKKSMDLIAERMGVTRAMTYVYLDRIRSLIVPKYGEDFGVAA